uniref:Uncharacterized protein n=1 Tax=Anguilla anguilla TaxID=7936 RepID=A0A0E9QBV4_ANGAN
MIHIFFYTLVLHDGRTKFITCCTSFPWCMMSYTSIKL